MDRARESDERLMQQVASGQRESLSILLRRHADSLLTFLHRMTGDHHLSEELFQEVFVAVWKYRRRYMPSSSFKAWLFGIAANKCRAEYRARHTSVSFEAAVAALPVAREPSPIEGVVAMETANLVKQALRCLPEAQRQVVVLRIWNNFSYWQIAEVLACPESTVRSQMHRGLVTMRRYLERRM